MLSMYLSDREGGGGERERKRECVCVIFIHSHTHTHLNMYELYDNPSVHLEFFFGCRV
jgi:hypothetical protein